MSSWIPEGREPPSTAAIASATAILAATVGYFIGQASSIGLFGGDGAHKRKKAKPVKESQGWPNNYDVTIHPDSSDEELMEHLRGGQINGKERGGRVNSEPEQPEEEDKDELEVEDVSGELKTFADSREECKLVLCVRTDLGMGKGTYMDTHLTYPPLFSVTMTFPPPRMMSYRSLPRFTALTLNESPGKIAAQASHATLANYVHLQHHHQSNSPLLKRWERLGQAKIAVQVSSEEQLEELQARAMSLGLCARVIRDAGRTQIQAGSATVLGVGPGPKSVVDQVTGGLKLL